MAKNETAGVVSIMTKVIPLIRADTARGVISTSSNPSRRKHDSQNF